MDKSLLKGAIDADAHILEPADLWETTLENKYKDRAMRLRTNKDGLEYVEIDQQPSWFITPGSPATFGAMGVEDLSPRPDFTYMEHYETTSERLAYMDKAGVDKAILYASLGLQCVEIKDPELHAAHVRAYNRWVTDYCKNSDGRLFAAAMLSLDDDPKNVAAELEQSVKNGAVGGFFLPGHWGFKSPAHPDYDPLWAKAQELDVPLAIHPSAEPTEQDIHKRFADLPASTTEYMENSFYVAVCNFQAVQQCFVSYFHYGLFDRFPNIKALVLETGALWAPHLIDRMDNYGEGIFHSAHRSKPSDSFRKNCWISADPDELDLPFVMDRLGSDRFFWASDYPHPDHPITYMDDLEQTVTPMSQEYRENLLWKNVTTAFNL